MTLTPLRKNRDFMLLQTGQLLSTAGTNMSVIAFPLLVLSETGSPAKAGIVQFARYLPMLVIGPLAGVAADQRNRKRLMVAADIVSALAIGSLVAAVAADDVAYSLILVVAFVDASASMFFHASKSGAFRAVVPKEQLPDAASVEMGRASVVRLAAPPLGGALFGIARVLPFVADVVSYAFSTASILLMRTPFQEERVRDRSPIRTQLAEGFRFLWSAPLLRVSAVLIGISNFSVIGCQFALIVLAQRQGLSGAAIGGLVALTGATTLLGSITSPAARRLFEMRHILMSEFWAVYGVVAYFIWPNVYVLAVALAAQAFCFPNTDAAINAYRYAMTPDRLISRVLTAATTIVVAVMPLGPLAAGFLLDSVSARLTIFLLTAGTMVAAIVGTLSRSVRELPPLSQVTTSASPAEAG
jgi:MFS family permease